MSKKPTVLMILDGYGLNNEAKGNAVSMAKTPVMDKLMKDRTVFVIAHRLSTVRDSNVIMVLDMGRIIERGNHEKLIEEKGKYYQLYTGAFELE